MPASARPSNAGGPARKKLNVKMMKMIDVRNSRKSSLRLPALAAAMLGMVGSANAQYSNPPTWSPMTMLTVSFDTATLRLGVVDQATKMGVGVYPVLTLAPAGTYDPAQPWGVLNGTEYSRRLGWDDVNKTQTDGTAILDKIHTTYGAGANLWIESIAQDSALKCYLAIGRYGVNANNTMTVDPAINAYSGIFGTAGSSTRWLWDGKMDHNTYAVSLADIASPWQLFSATYKVYVGDAVGNEILNPDLSSASTIETWTWQAVPEPTTLGLAVMGLIGLLVSRKTTS
jgi:hypothetical protein